MFFEIHGDLRHNIRDSRINDERERKKDNVSPLGLRQLRDRLKTWTRKDKGTEYKGAI